MATTAVAVILTLFSPAAGKAFLADVPANGPAARGASGVDSDLRRAMNESLGCGGKPDHEGLAAIQHRLLPMWRTMPKNAHGRIERRLLRYAVHRYFMQRSSISVRGFEPTRPSNASNWGADDVLSQRVPAFVEGVLEGPYAERGFTLEDLATMVVTLEQLIFDTDRDLLEEVYQKAGWSTKKHYSKQQLSDMLVQYMRRWIGGEASDDLEDGDIPHWDEIEDFVKGQVEGFAFARWRSLLSRGGHRVGLSAASPFQLPAREGAAAFDGGFSFSDAHAVVGSVTQSFGFFWEDVCKDMKQVLAGMDKRGTGRVKLSDFYDGGMTGHWRFGESEAYLRDLGALDESSRWHGKQVIIPNYLQATSNCIVYSQHYHVCCANECEILMGEIEGAIQEPVASPERILDVVGNMTSHSSVDEPPTLTQGLVAQLRQIAGMHGGQVPLHGRLFAQWLHYVFPRECPFPQRAGDPEEFGDAVLATKEEMGKHAHGLENATRKWEEKGEAPPPDAHWMSQWSDEEELLADYTGQLKAPWETRRVFGAAAGIGICLVILLVGMTVGREDSEAEGGSLDTAGGKRSFMV